MTVIALLVACTPKDSGTVPDDTDEPPDTSNPTETTEPETTALTGDTGPTLTGCALTCNDDLPCSEDTCDAEGRCIAVPLSICPWPASLPPNVTGLAGLDPSGDLRISVSGATWNATTRELWTVRGNGATAWRFVEDGAGGWRIDDNGAGGMAKWSLGLIDAESVTLADPVGRPTILHVMIELEERIAWFDVSDPAEADELGRWDTTPWLDAAGIRGSEALTFVPDTALAEWGFVDGLGAPRTSTLGFGGLFFVGTQNGGQLHAFDLSSTTGEVQYAGAFDTERDDTSGLEFDADTGRLYIWHGDGSNDLEITRLSSTDVGGGRRKLDTEYVFDYLGSANIEGIALMGLADCTAGGRPMFLVTDDGGDRAVDVYPDWPLCRP